MRKREEFLVHSTNEQFDFKLRYRLMTLSANSELNAHGNWCRRSLGVLESIVRDEGMGIAEIKHLSLPSKSPQRFVSSHPATNEYNAGHVDRFLMLVNETIELR